MELPKDVEQDPQAPKIPGYVLTWNLGRGAFSQVWKAWQVRTRRWVAVKVFLQKGGVNWDFLQREVEQLIRLDKHPHIVSILDADLGGDPPYYVMDYLEHGSFELFVCMKKPAPAEKAAQWLDEIAQALSYVHSKGLIHCSLKPTNVLLDEEGHARVADFGQSRTASDTESSLFYTAPEQAVPREEGEPIQPDVRWDIYGLGTTMWAVLAGRLPRGDDEHRKLLERARTPEWRLKCYREIAQSQPLESCRAITQGKVDEDLGAIIDKCAQANAAKRYSTVAEVLADLKARREHRPVSPLAYRPLYRFKRFTQRRAALAALCCVAFAGLLWTGFKILRQQEGLKRQLAISYAQQARQYSNNNENALAAAYYAESNRLLPSHMAQANALGHIAALGVPRHLLQHAGPVISVAFSPDGKRVLTGSQDNTAQLWDVGTGKPLGKAMRHDLPVEVVAFSSDGTRMLTTDSNAVKFWDARTGKLINTLEFVRLHFPPVSIMAAALSPDGERLLLADIMENARIWNAATGAPMTMPMRHEGWVHSVAFSPNGKYALSGSHDKTARLWDARTGRPAGRVMRHSEAVLSVAFSPDGKMALTGSEDKTARLWDVKTGEPRGRIMRLDDAVKAVAFSLDGKFALTGSYDKTVRLWDAKTGEPSGRVVRSDYPVTSVAFNPDGRSVLAGTEGGTAWLWDVASLKSVDIVLRHDSQVIAAAFSPDGGSVLTSGRDNIIRLWDAHSGKPMGKAMRHDEPVNSIAFSPDGKKVLTSGYDDTARLWDARTGEPIGKPLAHNTSAVWSAVVSPDGNYVLTGCWDGAARVWDARTGDLVGKEMRHESWVTNVSFSPDGERVLTGSPDHTARLWHTRTGDPIGNTMRHDAGVMSIAFSPDGLTLLTGSLDNTARLWDAMTGEPVGKVMLHGKGVDSAVFSPDGQRVLTGSRDQTARLWDAKTGEPIGKIMRHDNSVVAVAFSPDGRSALTGSGDRTARLWDAYTGEPIGKIMRHDAPVTSVAFSSDGKRVLSSSIDKTARLWDVSWLLEDNIPSGKLTLLAQEAGFLRINQQGELEPISAEEWYKLKKLLGR